MATCPNKNLKEWKDLVTAYGVYKAHYLWDKLGGAVEPFLPKDPSLAPTLKQPTLNPDRELEGDLDTRLQKNFLADFGFEVNRISIKDSLGLDNTQLVDLFERLIYIDENTPLDRATAYIGYRLLGKANKKLASNLKYRIYSWDKYNERFDKYKNEIKETGQNFKNKKDWHNFIREKVIIDYLAEVLVEYDKNPTEFMKTNDRQWTSADFSVIKDLINEIKDLLQKLFNISFRNKEKDMVIMGDIAKQLADEIISGNYEMFKYELAPDQIQKYYEETIESDPQAHEIVKFAQSLGIILTGSLALRKFGSLFRTVKESIHDLDFIIPYSRNNSKENADTLTQIIRYQDGKSEDLIAQSAEVAAELVPRFDWYKAFIKKYPTYKMKRAFYGTGPDLFRNLTVLGVVDGEFYETAGLHDKKLANGKIVKAFHKKGDHIEDTGYLIDFFVNTRPELEGEENFLHIWKEIMLAKLAMGRSKDLTDWLNFVPFKRASPMDMFKYPDYMFSNKATTTSQEEEIITKEYLRQSIASKATLEMVLKAAKEMGINITSLEKYAKSNPSVDVDGINGLADLVKKTIAIAEGKEAETLTEEVVHIATAILEQVDPKLLTNMLAKIDRFTIYKKVLDSYSKRKDYQLPNGKPDIRKIKKEAVDKLIAEVIINKGGNFKTFNELLQEENVSMVKSWWRTILDFIRGIYSKSSIDIFKQAADTIINGNIGSVDSIKSEGVFFQLNSKGQVGDNPKIDAFYDTIISNDNNMTLLEEIPDGPDKRDRHYIIKEALGTITRITQSVTQKIKGSKEMPARTGIDKIMDDAKKEWGSAGHLYLETYFKENLIDNLGFALETPKDDDIDTTLPEHVTEKLRIYATTLVSSYPKGTRFVVEKMVVNKERTLGSTIDFTAIVPMEKKDGTKTFIIDNFDWKFTSFKEEDNTDIPWYKRSDWVGQMAEYIKIYYDYGLKKEQVRKARMIPFVLEYSPVIPFMPEAGIYPSTLKIGGQDDVLGQNAFTLPVPIRQESTGNSIVDKLVSSLYVQYDKDYDTYGNTVQYKIEKNIRLNELSLAIRKLQVAMDFSPLVNIGATFLKRAETILDEYENLDYSTLGKSEINSKLAQLNSLIDSSTKFRNLDKIFTSTYENGFTAEQKIVFKNLKRNAERTENVLNQISELQKQFTLQLSVISGFSTEENKDSVLMPEKAVGFLSKSFLESSRLPIKLLKLGTNLLLRSKKFVDIKYQEQVDAFSKLLIPLEKIARSRGVSAFSMIGTVMGSNLKLIHKIDNKFNEALKQARIDKNSQSKKFIMDNINLEEFNKDVEIYINLQIKALTENVWDPNSEENNDRILTRRIAIMKDNIDINRPNFKGWHDFHFVNLVNKHIKEDLHLSKEYKEMAKTPEALAMWEYFTKLNKKALDLGYLTTEGVAFVPLIEATTLQKLARNKNGIVDMAKNFYSDFTTNNLDEKKKYASVDPETLEIKKRIPTYFTKTDKAVKDLSQDLSKLGSLYIKALLDYENNVNMENIMLTLLQVEKTKGGLLTNNNELVRDEQNDLIVTDINPNAEIFESVIDDSIYGKSEDSKGMLTDSQEKIIENANTYIRSQGVGLRWALSISNWVGAQFHAFIMQGNVYSFKEYEKNNLNVLTNRLSTEQRALIDMIVPLGDNIVTDNRRKMTKEYSYIDYLNTWTFSDVMQVTNSFPDRLLQIVNAASFNENTMIVGDRLVNIREYVKAEDRKNRVGMSFEERKELKNSQERRIQELKDTKSLIKVISVDENGVKFPPGTNITKQELARYSVKVLDYGRNLNGQMDSNNKAAYRRNILARSFMMFKSWIPKMISQRYIDIHYNAEQENWEYGRSLVYIRTLKKIGFQNIYRVKHLLLSTEEGLKIMDELLEERKAAYFLATGQQLEITTEEFYDVMNQEISAQTRELRLLVSVLATLIAVKAAEPPEDASDLEKNRYKFYHKALAKITDELSFYYNPFTFQSITKGSLIPALNILVSAGRAIGALEQEVQGYALGDEKLVDKSYPIKYFLNLIPVASQVQNDLLPMINEEWARELGVRVQKESRQK